MPDLSVAIVDALNAIFGSQRGCRAVHGTGVVCQGVFRAAPRATSVCRAAHFREASVPITVRFSDFPGVPDARDGDPGSSPRGMAIQFRLPGGANTDIVAHSYDGFPVADGEEFLAFARALAASGPAAPKPTPIETFAASRPRALAFLQAPKPIPASFATEPYFGVNAFRFTNASGATRHGRYRIMPVAGAKHLDSADAAARPPHFLFDELRARLARGPAEWRLLVQLANPGDPVHDGSQSWPEDRGQVEMGTVSVEAVDADSAAAERALIFDPTRLVDGIELSEDPLPRIRSQAYSVSYERRHA